MHLVLLSWQKVGDAKVAYHPVDAEAVNHDAVACTMASLAEKELVLLEETEVDVAASQEWAPVTIVLIMVGDIYPGVLEPD